MQEPADLAFARWCRAADSAALGELFDATAPRLLKLAIHLVGDSAAAEDLVQQVFLAAIEQRTRLDAARPAWPWLTGVLANLAKKHHRRAGRAVELEATLVAAEDTGRALERRELDGEVARAIDALDEPYREVVLLRLRHGMEPADIAHVLARDAGTVRVQLHRGFEKLRAALPAGLVAGLALLWMAPRGLAVLRAEVVASASAASAAPTTLALGGSLLAKTSLGAAAAALVASAIWLWPREDRGKLAAAADRRADAAAPEPAEDTVATETGSARPAAQRESTGDGDSASAAHLTGVRVVDAETRDPIGGARLALHAPRTASAFELLAASPELYDLGANGELRPRGSGDWPLVSAPSAAARFGRASLTAFDRPRQGEQPLAEATTDAEGLFELPLGEQDAVLELAADGYATRWCALRAGVVPTTFPLWREREVHGRVLLRLESPPEPIELVLCGFHLAPPVEAAAEEPRAPIFHGDPETLGAWVVSTEPDGRFRARVGAARVSVDVLTEGYGQRMRGSYDAEREIQIFLTETPLFRFHDTASGAPVERVRLLARELDLDWPRWTGEFAAPGGRLALPSELSFLLDQSSSFELFAWSEDHAPARLPIARLADPEVYEVALERGGTAVLRGQILQDGAPLAGAEVALLAYRTISWLADGDALVDAVSTAGDGRFQLTAPPGKYLLRARTDGGPFLERVTFSSGWIDRPAAGREPWFESVELPTEREFVLDLARGARIDVELVDAEGRPRPDFQVVLSGQDRRSAWLPTDAQGRVGFVRLPAGTYELFLPPNGERSSFAHAPERAIELADGERELVRIELAPETEPHARIHARDTQDYTGWEVRLGSDAWQEALFDGALPGPIEPGTWRVDVRAPDGRRWWLDLPENLADGHVFELDAGGLAYAGELLRPDGSPASDVAVLALTSDPTRGRLRTIDVTDAQGRFELPGLGSTKPWLEFQTNLERELGDSWGNTLAGYQFEPAAEASETGTWLALRTPGSGPMRIHGTLRDAAGAPLPGRTVFLDGHTVTPAGRWHVKGKEDATYTDSQGAFDVELPAAPSVHLRVWDESTRTLVLDREADVFGPELGLDLRAP